MAQTSSNMRGDPEERAVDIVQCALGCRRRADDVVQRVLLLRGVRGGSVKWTSNVNQVGEGGGGGALYISNMCRDSQDLPKTCPSNMR